jgi:hypothetical protein
VGDDVIARDLADLDAAGTPRHTDDCAWWSCLRSALEGGDLPMARMMSSGCPPCDCGLEERGDDDQPRS